MVELTYELIIISHGGSVNVPLFADDLIMLQDKEESTYCSKLPENVTWRHLYLRPR